MRSCCGRRAQTPCVPGKTARPHASPGIEHILALQSKLGNRAPKLTRMAAISPPCAKAFRPTIRGRNPRADIMKLAPGD